jgi:hypothetical protein
MRGLSVLRSIGAAVDDGALHSITSSAWSRTEGELRSSGKRKTNGDEAPRPSGNLVEFKFPANQGIFLAEEILNFAANHWNYAWQLRVRRGGFPRREQQNSELELPNRPIFVKALKASLQLKQEFPDSSVKLRDADENTSLHRH